MEKTASSIWRRWRTTSRNCRASFVPTRIPTYTTWTKPAFSSTTCRVVCFAATTLTKDKARITLAVCTNATGTDKLPLLFIGTAAKPRWFNKKPADVIYTSASKAWMTTPTFQAWLRDVDQSMREQQRHILIRVDNVSSHCDDGVVLANVRLAKLPPNTTSKLQPLVQGIIYCLKRNVLQKKMEYALERIDDGELNPYNVGMLKDIEWCAEAWREMPMETIQHCWLHSTLIAKSDLNFILP
ncbi:unnamed protein product [Phytophthora fragariaefolia]|uniref:Unnamed protein product n=1 Tax=Phytophthora fragariaefolia TaxID=1490495 RepID=A0A9W6WZK8_9STRA|nr:unnamed protein product [Phytophthora fragariaefolia]